VEFWDERKLILNYSVPYIERITTIAIPSTQPERRK